jgi:hypothetical protein
MSLSGRFFAAIYDTVLAATEKAGLEAHRKTLLSTAAGRVIVLDLVRIYLLLIFFLAPLEIVWKVAG